MFRLLVCLSAALFVRAQQSAVATATVSLSEPTGDAGDRSSLRGKTHHKDTGGAANAPDSLLCQVTERDSGANPSALLCDGQQFHLASRAPEAGDAPPGSGLWWTFLFCSLGCIITAAMAAGLTMGLVSIDVFDLDLLLEMKPDEMHCAEAVEDLQDDKQYAERLRPLIAGHFWKQGCFNCIPERFDPTNKHFLLVTLLIVNAMANEALPVFLDNVVPAWAAVLISVSFVLVFGEIIPSAVFTGPGGMAIASHFAGCVGCLKLFLSPVVWPISLILDRCLEHEDESIFHRGKLKALVRLQQRAVHRENTTAHSVAGGLGLAQDEIDMIHGSLDLHIKTVSQVQEPIAEAKMLPLDTVLDEDTLADVLHWGHSRIFVYDGDRHNVRGLIMVKKLIVINPELKRPLNELHLRKPLVLSPKESLLTTLNSFQTGRSHLALISADPAAVKKAWETNTPIPSHAWPQGFLTMEDIIEELLREEVFDEDDRETAFGILHKANKLKRLRAWAARAKNTVKRRHDKAREEQQRLKEQGPLSVLRTPLMLQWRRSTDDAPVSPNPAGNRRQTLG